MANLRCGKQTILFDRQPSILCGASVVGKREKEGPLSAYFDITETDTRFGQPTWEKAEQHMQQLALELALKKAGCGRTQPDLLFAGDLLNQCISTGFACRNRGIPLLGLYGACSTMAEALCLAGMAVNAGYADTAAALTSSHFASAERQYRFPLNYGGQRTPTAQWTVTGAGCMLVGQNRKGPVLQAATIGTVTDWGIKDANNMGAAMAPAAYSAIRTHLDDRRLTPADFDLIVTGDLGSLGMEILMDLFRRDGISIGGVCADCGVMIFDPLKQDVHAGGSGCGCSAVVLCGYLLKKLQEKKLRQILFCGTGALLSTVSSQQGESIPSICHVVAIGAERSSQCNI